MVTMSITIEGDKAARRRLEALGKRARLDKLGPPLWRQFAGYEKQLFASEGASGPDGRWKALKPSTIEKKRALRQPLRILEAEGDLLKSLTRKTPGPNSVRRVSRDTIELGTKDPKAKHHQYGAPRNNLAKRPPVALTKQQKKEMVETIRHFVLTGERRG